MRAWLAQHGRTFDVINTHSSTDAWLVALAGATLRGMPPVVRTRHVSTPVNNSATTRWLYQRATARTRGDRRGTEGPARARQRIRSAADHVGAHRHRPRALSPAGSRRRARAPWRRCAARGGDPRDVARLEGPRRSAGCVGGIARARARMAIAGDRRWSAPRASRRTGGGHGPAARRALHGQPGRRARLVCVRRRGGAAVVRRRRRAAEPHAGGRVRPARGVDADRRDPRGRARWRNRIAGAAARSARSSRRRWSA